jgi:hypothetical protein
VCGGRILVGLRGRLAVGLGVVGVLFGRGRVLIAFGGVLVGVGAVLSGLRAGVVRGLLGRGTLVFVDLRALSGLVGLGLVGTRVVGVRLRRVVGGGGVGLGIVGGGLLGGGVGARVSGVVAGLLHVLVGAVVGGAFVGGVLLCGVLRLLRIRGAALLCLGARVTRGAAVAVRDLPAELEAVAQCFARALAADADERTGRGVDQRAGLDQLDVFATEVLGSERGGVLGAEVGGVLEAVLGDTDFGLAPPGRCGGVLPLALEAARQLGVLHPVADPVEPGSGTGGQRLELVGRAHELAGGVGALGELGEGYRGLELFDPGDDVQ